MEIQGYQISSYSPSFFGFPFFALSILISFLLSATAVYPIAATCSLCLLTFLLGHGSSFQDQLFLFSSPSKMFDNPGFRSPNHFFLSSPKFLSLFRSSNSCKSISIFFPEYNRFSHLGYHPGCLSFKLKI